MGSERLNTDVLNRLKDFIKAEKYGPCIMVQIFPGGDIAVLWKHWQCADLYKCPRVFIGGKFKNQKPIIKYLWLNTKQT